MNKLIFFALLFCTPSILFAQYEFSGKVVDTDQSPIIGATVRIENTSEGTITNEDGIFSFTFSEPTTTIAINYLIYDGPIVREISANEFLTIQLTDASVEIEPVFISAKYPITQNTVTASDFASQNLGQDIPILLEQLPSVVSTSDAGAGIGYSALRVRGSDATRVNVTVNGIPLNDSESQGLFWVNMPDFASSTGKLTLVRGAGSSTNGAGAFGASLHLETESLNEVAFAEYNGAAGSFSTVKNNLQFGTGKLGKWSANGRLSKITSDGYIDRASADLQSYFVQVGRALGSKELPGELKFITFKGHEETYQAWYGVREDQLAVNRTFNPYTYENQVDDYQQGHYQLLWNQNLSPSLTINTGLHYTKGQGFFEEFREEDDLEDYGISPITIGGETISTSDLVRRRWLDNDFYGLVASSTYNHEDHEFTLGGGWNRYLGDHFGEIIRGEFIPTAEIGEQYYQNDATKQDFNIYGKYTYDFRTDFGIVRPYVDLQYRNVQYDFVGLALDGSGTIQNLPQSVSHDFFNPKLGTTFDFGQHQLYASYSKAQKEPNRDDYTDSPQSLLPSPEELNDFELGYQFGNRRNQASVNGYFMDYKNQLVITGQINDVGEYSRINVPNSYRLGVELAGQTTFGNQNEFTINANAALSRNKVEEFTEYIDDYDNGGQQTIAHEETDLALSPNLIAGGSFTYQPNEVVKASLISKFVGDQYLDNTSSESRKINSYWVQNLNLTTSLGNYIPSLHTVDVNVLINNLFNEEYESNGYTFGYIYGGETTYENYYFPQAGTNYLVGLTIRFE